MSFLLIPKGSLGDHVCYTGLPKVLKFHFGKDIIVQTKYPKLFDYNPYVSRVILPNESRPEDVTGSFEIPYETQEWQWLVYKPIRAYYQLTGKIIDRKEVQPKIYFPLDSRLGYITIADQAGWKTRRGYSFLDNLANQLLDNGYHITVIHDPNYTDYNGNRSEREVNHYNVSVKEDYSTLIRIIAESRYFIGYDSGPAHIAQALGIPSIIFTGSVPPINVIHDAAIKVYDTCERHCNKENCEYNCLSNYKNVNDEIIDIIKKGI